MQSFPRLSEGQVAVMRADHNTGHILDIELKLVINDNQEAYSIYDDFQMAEGYVKKLILDNSMVECVIYDSKGRPIKSYNVKS